MISKIVLKSRKSRMMPRSNFVFYDEITNRYNLHVFYIENIRFEKN